MQTDFELKEERKLARFITLIKQSIQGKEHDYTQGSIKVAIVLLAIPMILELSLESVFAVVDIFFVGHLKNAKSAVTTVGLTESVITLVYTIGIGLSTGATAVVARRVGEKNFKEASHSGAQAILISVLISIIIGAMGFVFAADILKLMGAQPEVIEQGTLFTKMMMLSSPAIILLFLINGIFRGAGDAAMAMKSLWLASGVNILLCPTLVYGFGPFPEMGLVGAATATIIGRTAGVVYQCFHLFRKNRTIQLIRAYFTWDHAIIKNLLTVATPATFQFFIQSGSWIILAYLVSITGSTEASAGYQIAIRNVVFFILPAWGLSNAAATLVGQNLGAKQPGRAEKSVWLTTWYNVVFMTGVTILFVFFASPIINLFTKEAGVQQVGTRALQIMGSAFIFYGVGMVLVQALNGAGDTKTPTWINVICFWFIQVPLAWLLAVYLKMGPSGAFVAIPAAEIVLAIIAWYKFKQGAWKKVEV